MNQRPGLVQGAWVALAIVLLILSAFVAGLFVGGLFL